MFIGIDVTILRKNAKCIVLVACSNIIKNENYSYWRVPFY